MRRILIAYAILNILIISGCTNRGSASGKDPGASGGDSTSMASQVKYTCTMHPEIISDTAGHCPKCGMDLVPIKDSTKK